MATKFTITAVGLRKRGALSFAKALAGGAKYGAKYEIRRLLAKHRAKGLTYDQIYKVIRRTGLTMRTTTIALSEMLKSGEVIRLVK